MEAWARDAQSSQRTKVTHHLPSYSLQLSGLRNEKVEQGACPRDMKEKRGRGNGKSIFHGSPGLLKWSWEDKQVKSKTEERFRTECCGLAPGTQMRNSAMVSGGGT